MIRHALSGQEMTCHPVSLRAGTVNNDPSLIEPAMQ
jgi:hypothetical protein